MSFILKKFMSFMKGIDMMKKQILALSVITISILQALCFAELPAFPGAVGGGKYTVGGRGGTVYEVTNLHSYGPGSLRYGLETVTGPRTIVFRVGGTIDLGGNDIYVDNNPYVTIAGQTAPGDGIQIKNGGIVFNRTSEVIMRYVRIRRGPVDSADSLTVSAPDYSVHKHNAIFDHCSFYWGTDETVSTSAFDKLTVQNSIIAEGLHKSTYDQEESWDPYYVDPEGHKYWEHSRGIMFTYHSKENTMYHNLVYNNYKRNPLIQGSDADIVNNVMVNKNYQVFVEPYKDEVHVNFVGNYFREYEHSHRPIRVYDVDDGYDGSSDVYYEGNYDAYYRPDDSDPETDIRVLEQTGDSAGDGHVQDRATPYPFANRITDAESAPDAFDSVIAGVGCYAPGRIPRDTADLRVMKFVASGGAPSEYVDAPVEGYTGPYNDFGGWPEIASGEAPVDSDHDGMPDDWETSHGLDPNNADDRNGTDLSSEGYTNLEVYLNSLVPQELLLGDVNLDGRVDGTDLNTLLGNWGQDYKQWTDGDFNGDTIVDGTDLNSLLQNWGAVDSSYPGNEPTVPEPISGLIFAIGSFAIFARKK